LKVLTGLTTFSVTYAARDESDDEEAGRSSPDCAPQSLPPRR
jgi:hypothetical protein